LSLIGKIRALIANLEDALPTSPNGSGKGSGSRGKKKGAKNIKYVIKKLGDAKGAIKELEEGDSTDAAKDLGKAYKKLKCEKAINKNQDQTLIGFCTTINEIKHQVLTALSP